MRPQSDRHLGNHGHRVAEAVYPSRRVYAYVMP